MNKKEIKTIILAILIVAAIIVFYIFSFKNAMNKNWNNGICPSCGYKYELRAVSSGYKYYVCPYCGKEAQRWWRLK